MPRGVSSIRSVVLVFLITLASSGCERYAMPNEPTDADFGRVQATASPATARLIGRSASCPTFQPFLWTHRIEIRPAGSVPVTVIGWEASELEGTNSSFGTQRPDLATLNQCGAVGDGRLGANGLVCGDFNYCGATVAAGHRLQHRFYTVDDRGVPSTIYLDVPLATQ